MDYKQKHPETCLAKSLLILLEKLKKIKINDSKELEILNYSLKYDRENIARGHIEKIVKDFNVRINWYADGKIFYDFVKARGIPKKTKFILSKINLKLIDSILNEPLILYLDQFYLWERKEGLYYKFHYPHFIVVLDKVKNRYKIIDPNTGKIRLINSDILSKAIISLRSHLWFAPQIMTLEI